MSRATLIVFALLVAFAVGTGSASYAVANWLDLAGQQSGPWKRLVTTTQAETDPYKRALDHISGQLPIGSAEGQIYLASNDSDNQPLSASCNYTVKGDIPAARLFTLRAETPGGQLIIANAPYQGALHSDQLLFSDTGYTINISADAQRDNWLAIQTAGPFKLVLTYYDVAVINDDTGNSTRLPNITKGTCSSV